LNFLRVDDFGLASRPDFKPHVIGLSLNFRREVVRMHRAVFKIDSPVHIRKVHVVAGPPNDRQFIEQTAVVADVGRVTRPDMVAADLRRRLNQKDFRRRIDFR